MSARTGGGTVSLRHATPELVAQRVGKVLEDRPDARVIAVRAEPQWGGEPIPVAERHVVVRPCASPLAVRASLAEWDDLHPESATGGAGGPDLLVLLCELAESDLGEDVLARLSPPRVLSLEPWDAVKARFGVQRVDAAFGRDGRDDGWIARALLEQVPVDEARALGAGTTLTIELALTALARRLLGADGVGVDAVLKAAAHADPFAGLDEVDEETRSGLLDAIGRMNGRLGQVVADVLAAGRGDELLAIGLAARAVYGHGEYDGGRAAGRLEARCGGTRIDPLVGAALAERCEEAVDRLFDEDRDRANLVVAAASSVAREVEADHPEASRLLPEGFDRRLALAVEALRSALDDVLGAGRREAAGPPSFAELAEAIGRVAEHRDHLGPSGARRLAHLEMAARLVAWLASPPADGRSITAAASFEEAARAYAADGAWVDRARRRLWRGDDDPTVADVYRQVLDAVVARRRDENRRFAELLAAWTANQPGPEGLVAQGVTTVEAVADEVLARFGSTPVLFVVLDGCGLLSFGELADQFRDLGFREIGLSAAAGADQLGRRLAGVAALPTVTEVSRASLLAGKIDQGNQDHERRYFEVIGSITKQGRAPALFHQARLAGPAGGSLAAEVSRALDPERGPSVVGAVINTIDDQLKRGTFAETLRLEDLHTLVPLLEAARTYGRAVVISADHGHVLAQPEDGGTGTFEGGGSGGERWRAADRPAGDTEVLLRGSRVKLGGDAGVLAPWEDDYRYGAKAGGYHGGATPEEVLVPVAAYLPAGMDVPAGWQPVAEVPPLWWDLIAEAGQAGGATPSVPPSSVAAKPRKRTTKRVDESQPTMFDLPSEAPVVPAVAASPGPLAAMPSWLDDLLASEVWQVQKKVVAGRAALPDDRVRAVLAAANRRGGVASFAELAVATGMAPNRLPGFLAMLSRVLNVDGYPVLEVDVPTQELRLSLPLLSQQFGVDPSTP